MATAILYTKTGAEAGTLELPDALFAAPVNEAVLHQAVTAQLAGRHLGTHASKTRGMVQGGGRKPYRQKGTGRARQGSRRAPHYKGGGVVFGPQPRDHSVRLPRRMRRLALTGALTSKLADGGIKFVDELGVDEIRTKELVGYLDALEASGRVLLVAPARDEKLELSARNLPTVRVILADSLNVVDVLQSDILLITPPALDRMAATYAKEVAA